MHDIRWIRDNPEAFDLGLKRRGLDGQAAALIALDDNRRALVQTVQEAQARRNAASKEIAAAMGAGDRAQAEQLKGEVAALKSRIQSVEEEERQATAAVTEALSVIPNLPLEEVPDGPDADHNREIRRHGEPPSFAFAPKQHFELGEALGLMDFEAAAKLSGARFVVAQGKARPARTRARPVHARSADPRARLHRGQSAPAGARRRRCSAPGSCPNSPTICSAPPTAAG